MGVIAWIILGAIAGFIANMIMGSREGLLMMIVLGIVGAVVGGFIAGTVLHLADVTGINIESIVVAVIGAIIVIVVYRQLGGRRMSPNSSSAKRPGSSGRPHSCGHSSRPRSGPAMWCSSSILEWWVLGPWSWPCWWPGDGEPPSTDYSRHTTGTTRRSRRRSSATRP